MDYQMLVRNLFNDMFVFFNGKIGRASCRERVSWYV